MMTLIVIMLTDPSSPVLYGSALGLKRIVRAILFDSVKSMVVTIPCTVFESDSSPVQLYYEYCVALLVPGSELMFLSLIF